eukprot:GILJ01000678.1.p1 GENE.GILJ01000678.1~~GILJ01000678.1.p1  ORF type:complete len:592 (-),score=136.75 GILJ01000678.1:203-1921(-)
MASWEDQQEEKTWEDQQESAAPKPKLNPKAAAFNFNPTAMTFQPKTTSAPVASAPAATVPVAIPSSVPAVVPSAVPPSAPVAPAAAAPSPSSKTTTAPAAVPRVSPTPAEEAVEEELSSAVVDNADIKEGDPRDHLNIVFIGHVDAGKSTTAGHILYITGQVDDRTIAKFEREAKEKNRDSWFLAFIMDTNEEERAKGKTVEVGRAHFETATKRYTILDAPGHKNYVPNMISGAAQADIGVLVISARKGEFETGFERGGQTREHAMLAKTLGVKQLIVVINKMDESTVQWSQTRYEECVEKLKPFLKGCGYNVKTDVIFLPISGLTGANIKDSIDPSIAGWYTGPPLLTLLDSLKPPERNENGSLRIPLMDKYKEMGVIASGKVESGTVKRGQQCLLMPNRTPVEVISVYIDEMEVSRAKPGENLKVKLKGVEEEDIQKGFVLCDSLNPCQVVTEFDAQLVIMELLEHRPVMTAGYGAVVHIHTAAEECTISELLETIDRKTQKKKKKPMFVKNGAVVVARIQLNQPVCMETFSDMQQLGRFTLRDEGKTVAIGKVLAFRSRDAIAESAKEE